MTTLKQMIIKGFFTAALGYTAEAQADFVSGEVFGNDKGALIEVKGSASMGNNPNAQYFTRVRRFRGYDGKNSSFMQNEVSVGEWQGVRLLGQARLYGEHLVPQAGVSYFVKGERGSFYAALSASMQKDAMAELLMLGVVRVTDKIPLELEQIVSGNGGVLKGTSRAHVGYTFDTFSTGVAGEVDYGVDVPIVPKIGVYVRLRSK